MSVKVDNLRVYYRTLRGDVQAVDGVTFGIEDGEIMGLAGESGCGKSTLGKSLIRMDSRMQHVEGRVRLDDDVLPIADTKAMNRYRFKSVSIVPQYAMSAMTPTRKVGKMIEELLESRGVRFSTIRPELERRLTLVGLSVANLGDDGTVQLALPFHQRGPVDGVLDEIRHRFGTSAMTRAVLLGKDQGIQVPLLPD